jgi:hypothetical protein
VTRPKSAYLYSDFNQQEEKDLNFYENQQVFNQVRSKTAYSISDKMNEAYLQSKEIKYVSLSNEDLMKVMPDKEMVTLKENSSLDLNSPVRVNSFNEYNQLTERSNNHSNFIRITPVTESLKAEQLFDCLHDEIILCECCKYLPNTPITSFVKQASIDEQDEIFRLTATNKVEQLEQTGKESNTVSSVVNDKKKNNLRLILLENYDRKFASKIGINDYIPIEIMNVNEHQERKELEFIPYEDIDRRYRKYFDYFVNAFFMNGYLFNQLILFILKQEYKASLYLILVIKPLLGRKDVYFAQIRPYLDQSRNMAVNQLSTIRLLN